MWFNLPAGSFTATLFRLGIFSLSFIAPILEFLQDEGEMLDAEENSVFSRMEMMRRLAMDAQYKQETYLFGMRKWILDEWVTARDKQNAIWKKPKWSRNTNLHITIAQESVQTLQYVSTSPIDRQACCSRFSGSRGTHRLLLRDVRQRRHTVSEHCKLPFDDLLGNQIQPREDTTIFLPRCCIRSVESDGRGARGTGEIFGGLYSTS